MNNWKTTLTGITAAVTAALTALAALPASLGDISTLIPEAYKAKIVMIGLASTVILRVLKSLHTQDAKPAVPAPAPTSLVPMLLCGLLLLGGCTAYNATVQSRSDALRVDASKDSIGGEYIHSVTYR